MKGKCGKTGEKKFSNKRRKNENISFNLRKHVLVSVITEMAIQLYQY